MSDQEKGGFISRIAVELSEAKIRYDSWMNAVTKLGTSFDKLTHHRVVKQGIKLTPEQREEMYVHDDVARRIVDVIPDEMLRQGYRLEIADDEDAAGAAEIAQAAIDKAKELGLDAKVLEAMTWRQLHGIGAIFVGADDGQDASSPLDIENIRSIDFLTTYEFQDLTPATYYNDPFAPKFREVETWYVAHVSPGGARRAAPGQDGQIGQLGRLAMSQGEDGAVEVGARTTPRDGRPSAFEGERHRGATVTRIHESRMVIFEGALTPRNRKAGNRNLPLSLLETHHDVLQQFHTTWQSTAHLMTDMAQGVVTIRNLMEIIRSGNFDVLNKRIDIMNRARGVARVMMLDADQESFTRVATPIAGVSDILDKAMLRLTGAIAVPVSVFFGQDPPGLTSSGDIQIRRFYDKIRAAQSAALRPQLRRLFMLIMRSQDFVTGGEEPESWAIEFNDLQALNDLERADLRLKTVQADTIEINNETLLREEVALARHTGTGFNPGAVTIDRELRQQLLDVEKESLLEPPPEPPTPPAFPPPQPPQGEDDGEPQTPPQGEGSEDDPEPTEE